MGKNCGPREGEQVENEPRADGDDVLKQATRPHSCESVKAGSMKEYWTNGTWDWVISRPELDSVPWIRWWVARKLSST